MAERDEVDQLQFAGVQRDQRVSGACRDRNRHRRGGKRQLGHDRAGIGIDQPQPFRRLVDRDDPLAGDGRHNVKTVDDGAGDGLGRIAGLIADLDPMNVGTARRSRQQARAIAGPGEAESGGVGKAGVDRGRRRRHARRVDEERAFGQPHHRDASIRGNAQGRAAAGGVGEGHKARRIRDAVGAVRIEDRELQTARAGVDDDIDRAAVRRDRERHRRATKACGGTERQRVRIELVERAGIVGVGDEQPPLGLVMRDVARVRDQRRRLPVEARMRRDADRIGRVDLDLERKALEDAVRRAGGIVAAAIVEQYRNVLDRTFAIGEAEAQVVGFVIRLVDQRLDRREIRQRDHFGFDHQNVLAAAIDRAAGLQHHQAIAAGRVRMLHEIEPADDAGAMQPLVMQPKFLADIGLLVGEVALHQQLSGEVVVAHGMARFAIVAAERSLAGGIVLAFMMIIHDRPSSVVRREMLGAPRKESPPRRRGSSRRGTGVTEPRPSRISPSLVVATG